MQPPSRNQRPDPLTSLRNISLVLRLPREMHLCRSSSNVPRLPSFLDMLQTPHVFLTFGKVQNSLRLPRETTSERAKVLRACGVFNMLTSKCASRHNHVHFSTSQLQKVVRSCCVLTWTCASRHNGMHFFDISNLNCKKRSETWCVLCVLTWKRASHHNGVHFFDISTSKSGPKLLCFDLETLFAPQRRALFRHLNFKKWSQAAVF